MRALTKVAFLAVGAFSSAPVFAACEAPRYATKLAEASGELRLEAQASLLRGLSNSLRSLLGEKETLANASIGGRYAIAAAGGLASSAYGETIDAYFCALDNKVGTDPAKKALLEKERRAMRATLLKFFDAGRWQPENTDARDEISDELVDETSPPASFTITEIQAAIPKYNFDTLKISQIFGSVKIGDLVGVSGCGGLAYRSIRRIDPSVLSDLQLVPVVITKWLAGDRASAKLDMWAFVSAQMGKQLTTAADFEKLKIDETLIHCVDSAASAAEQKLAETPNAVSSPEPSQPMAGA